MNNKIDLTSKGDFTNTFSRTFFLFSRTLLTRNQRVPWDIEEEKYSLYVDGDERPWARIKWDDVQEVFCYRCGKRLSSDLPWNRKLHDLCFDCRNALRLHDYIDWEKDLFSRDKMKSKYDDVFLSEYRE